MLENDFLSQCKEYDVELPIYFYEKYSQFISAYTFDANFYLFLREFFLFEPDLKIDVGLTLCSLLRYIQQKIRKPNNEKKIWWAAKLGGIMAKKMDKRLREYKNGIQ